MQIGDVVVYKNKGLFRIEEIESIKRERKSPGKEYFRMRNLEDEKDILFVPAKDNEKMRKPVEKEEAMELIDGMDSLKELWVQNERAREKEYKECITSADVRGWMRIIKTVHDRKERKETITPMDKRYREEAEKALFGELAFVLKLPRKEVLPFIQSRREIREKSF